jgi:hypothetical protein
VQSTHQYWHQKFIVLSFINDTAVVHTQLLWFSAQHVQHFFCIPKNKCIYFFLHFLLLFSRERIIRAITSNQFYIIYKHILNAAKNKRVSHSLTRWINGIKIEINLFFLTPSRTIDGVNDFDLLGRKKDIFSLHCCIIIINLSTHHFSLCFSFVRNEKVYLKFRLIYISFILF